MFRIPEIQTYVPPSTLLGSCDYVVPDHNAMIISKNLCLFANEFRKLQQKYKFKLIEMDLFRLEDVKDKSSPVTRSMWLRDFITCKSSQGTLYIMDDSI